MIEARNLTKIYKTPASQVIVFEEVNLKVTRGKLVSIVGPSGAGKSTLLHLLGALDTPTRGEVLFKNENIFKWTGPALARFRNRHIGFVFQFHHLLPEFTTFENAMMPKLIRGDVRADAERAARQMLERVGLGHRLDHKVGEISGGEQQRVAIARALVGEPELLLADEPTGNLDSQTGIEIMKLFDRLHQEGNTIILVTHERDIAEFAHRVISIRDGKIASDEQMKKPTPSPVA